MRGKLVLTFLAGLAVGLVFVAAGGRQQRAQARQLEKQVRQLEQARLEKPTRWEYKVMKLSLAEDEAARQLNQLAGDHWEYVGLVNTSVPGLNGSPAYPASVAFRRPKK